MRVPTCPTHILLVFCYRWVATVGLAAALNGGSLTGAHNVLAACHDVAREAELLADLQVGGVHPACVGGRDDLLCKVGDR